VASMRVQGPLPFRTSMSRLIVIPDGSEARELRLPKPGLATASTTATTTAVRAKKPHNRRDILHPPQSTAQPRP
jgi:hypothetical protein